VVEGVRLTDDELRDVADLYLACGRNKAEYARQAGITRSGARRRVQRAMERGFLLPDADAECPDGYKIKGTSTLYKTDEDGRTVKAIEWVKTDVDKERQHEMAVIAAQELAKDIKPQKPIKLQGAVDKDLCTMYTLTDYHFGMLAWHEQGGDDWDLKIAEKTLMDCFSDMIARSPSSDVAILAQLGDFLHSDGLAAVTPTSGHHLDQDGRFEKIAAAAVRVLRQVVNMMLAKHDKVHVLMAEGNHDIASSLWLRVMFKALYEEDERVTVDCSALPYYVYEHGKVMIAFHHGHLKKKVGLPGLFAAQFPQMWGRTEHRVVHVGHMHHMDIKDTDGMRVHQHGTLAARDAYAARGGWISPRYAEAITYHKDCGYYGSVVTTPHFAGNSQQRSRESLL
jgi:hypothetical protein